MRHMSFFLTQSQLRVRSKTVTRRLGWLGAKAGDVVQPVVKGQGLKAGERAQTLGGPIRFRSVRREPLSAIEQSDVPREGFLGSAQAFIDMFCQHNHCTPDTEVTRIEFEYID
jgi:hypothetical protein